MNASEYLHATATMNASEYLHATADLLKKDGWVKHKGHYKGHRCMAAALIDTSMTISISKKESTKAYKTLAEVIGGNSNSSLNIVAFNDKHCETKNDAIAALRIAADLAA